MRTCFGISIVVALASAPRAGAAEKRAITLPDLYCLKGVEEPALAPDGKTLYFLASTPLGGTP
ncbi:MAG: hypothetical protein DMF79_10790 [Acidobacteria bacterium]|nr:MAG: hypothetical protein DMF79_10790 [Acidobacteriota bacterium]